MAGASLAAPGLNVASECFKFPAAPWQSSFSKWFLPSPANLLRWRSTSCKRRKIDSSLPAGRPWNSSTYCLKSKCSSAVHGHVRREPRRLKCLVRGTGSGGLHEAQGGPALDSRTSGPSEPASVHFVGIGGSGLSALASLALEQGLRVSGSDIENSPQLDRLRSLGAQVHVGHAAANICELDLPGAVVVSSAVPKGNVEVEAARGLGLPVYSRGEWLARVTSRYHLVAVSGTHGKTTTTSMLALALRDCGMDVTALVGAHVVQFPGRGSILVGKGPLFVLEADEYDGCFLHLSPLIAVVTNVEWEHVDKFKDEGAVRDMFAQFAAKLRPGGVLVVCGDNAGARAVARSLSTRDALHSKAPTGRPLTGAPLDPGAAGAEALDFWAAAPQSLPGMPEVEGSLRGMAGARGFRKAQVLQAPEGEAGFVAGEAEGEAGVAGRRVVTYGLEEGHDWRSIMLSPNPQGGTDFVAVHEGVPVARVALQQPGTHNVLNALAVLAVSSILSSMPEVAQPQVTERSSPAQSGHPVGREGTVVTPAAVVGTASMPSSGPSLEPPSPGHLRGSMFDLLDRAPAGPARTAEGGNTTRAMGQGPGQSLVQRAALSLAGFEGACRRFELVGRSAGGVVLIDDYAHHPTEIRATLQAARQRYDSVPIWVVFQPHTYSRTARLLEDMAPAFSAANRVIVTQIYAAREDNPWNISGQDLADIITGPQAVYIPALDDVISLLEADLQGFIRQQVAAAKAAPGFRWPPPPGDLVVITMGAGTVTRVCRVLAGQLPPP